jgi:hypothetical protein
MVNGEWERVFVYFSIFSFSLSVLSLISPLPSLPSSFFFCLFWNRVFLCTQTGLEHATLQPQPGALGLQACTTLPRRQLFLKVWCKPCSQETWMAFLSRSCTVCN